MKLTNEQSQEARARLEEIKNGEFPYKARVRATFLLRHLPNMSTLQLGDALIDLQEMTSS